MASLTKKVIAVTGAASGIGAGTAQLLARRGAVLALADMQSEVLDQVAEDIRKEGGTCTTTSVDVRDHNTVDRWMNRTVQALGKLDGAVNCAGVFKTGTPIASMSDTEWDEVLNINLTGMFKCLRVQLQNIKDGGSVVNMASASWCHGVPLSAHYAASKHGVVGLTRSAAKEMAVRRIRVNCIAPGVIETPMLVASGKSSEKLMNEIRGHTPMARMGSTEELVKTVGFLLSEESTFTTGAVLAVDGGMTS